jgi:hypothetical protein
MGFGRPDTSAPRVSPAGWLATLHRAALHQMSALPVNLPEAQDSKKPEPVGARAFCVIDTA